MGACVDGLEVWRRHRVQARTGLAESDRAHGAGRDIYFADAWFDFASDGRANYYWLGQAGAGESQQSKAPAPAGLFDRDGWPGHEFVAGLFVVGLRESSVGDAADVGGRRRGGNGEDQFGALFFQFNSDSAARWITLDL